MHQNDHPDTTSDDRHDDWPSDMLGTPGMPLRTDYAQLQQQRMAEVSSEMREVFAAASRFDLRGRGPQQVRAQLANQPGMHVLAPGVTASNIQIPGPAGPIPTRVYMPADATGPVGVYLATHGGGWMFLNGLTNIDTSESRTVLDWGCAVVHPDFRVAPEHKFPAAIEDCSAAYRYVVDHADEMGFDTTRIGIGGGCTGANIATVVAMLARDEGLPTPAIQYLWSPALDARNNYHSHIEFGSGYGLSLDDADFAVQTYLRDREDTWDWRASPVLAPSLAGSSPALIWVGEWEVLRDETRHYANRLRDAGVPVDYMEGPRQGHGMIYARNVDTGEPTACARQGQAQVNAIMREYIGPVDGHR